jgi:hypothetical protein
LHKKRARTWIELDEKKTSMRMKFKKSKIIISKIPNKIN